MDERTDRCRLCQAEIIWGETYPGGKKIPLDAKASVFDLSDLDVARKQRNMYVVHMAVCPYGDDQKQRRKGTVMKRETFELKFKAWIKSHFSEKGQEAIAKHLPSLLQEIFP